MSLCSEEQFKTTFNPSNSCSNKCNLKRINNNELYIEPLFYNGNGILICKIMNLNRIKITGDCCYFCYKSFVIDAENYFHTISLSTRSFNVADKDGGFAVKIPLCFAWYRFEFYLRLTIADGERASNLCIKVPGMGCIPNKLTQITRNYVSSINEIIDITNRQSAECSLFLNLKSPSWFSEESIEREEIEQLMDIQYNLQKEFILMYYYLDADLGGTSQNECPMEIDSISTLVSLNVMQYLTKDNKGLQLMLDLNKNLRCTFDDTQLYLRPEHPHKHMCAGKSTAKPTRSICDMCRAEISWYQLTLQCSHKLMQHIFCATCALQALYLSTYKQTANFF